MAYLSSRRHEAARPDAGRPVLHSMIRAPSDKGGNKLIGSSTGLPRLRRAQALGKRCSSSSQTGRR